MKREIFRTNSQATYFLYYGYFLKVNTPWPEPTTELLLTAGMQNGERKVCGAVHVYGARSLERLGLVKTFHKKGHLWIRLTTQGWVRAQQLGLISRKLF